MGCVLSRRNINDIHPNIFKVMNVDDSGNRLSPGQLEITANDLILHQQGKNSTKWPLRCLRRYGFDAELFSFESGRRCSTGPGIYAFKCSRAEQLFTLLQSHIQLRNNLNEDSDSHDLPLSPSNGLSCAARTSPVVDPNYLEPHRLGNTPRLRNWVDAPSNGSTLNRLSIPPFPPKHYIGTNGDDDAVTETENCNGNAHVYINVNVNGIKPTSEPEKVTYSNVDLDLPHRVRHAPNNYIHLDNVLEESEPSRVYINVLAGSLSPTSITSDDVMRGHDYMNLEADMVKLVSEPFDTKNLSFPAQTNQTVNYLLLDLENNSSDPNPSPSSLHSNNLLFDSKPSEPYATIDFEKTEALSHTVVPNSDNDKEGCRKTRHHSTIAGNDCHMLGFSMKGSSSLSD